MKNENITNLLLIKRSIAFLLFFLITFALMGCSGGKGEVTAPDNLTGISSPARGNGGTTGLWGLWEIRVDTNTGTCDIILLRQADLAINVIGFLEPPALKNLAIDTGTITFHPKQKYIGIDVILTHPFVTKNHVFNGFDVKGIVFGPAVVNADGLTRYFNPNDFTGTPFGYKDGILGTPDISANYPKEFNGYKYFADGIGMNETVAQYYSKPSNVDKRGIFSEGSKIKRHYDLRFGTPNTNFMIFNYAVYASYNWPQGTPPYSLDDFDITTCNQAEPVFISVKEVSNTLIYNPDTGSGKGAITLEITTFDWVKPANPEIVLLQAPGVIAQKQATFVSDIDTNRRLYTISATGAPKTSADIDITISITTEKTYGEHYILDLMPVSHPLYDEQIEARFVYAVGVKEMGVIILPYEDPMDSTTKLLWTIQHGAGHHPYPACDWTQSGGEWQSNGGKGIGGNYANYMDTYLISPEIKVPSDGNFYLYITHRYSTESPSYNLDYCDIMVRYLGTTAWIPFAADSMSLKGDSPGWPNWAIGLYQGNLTPGAVFQLGFHFYTDNIVYAYPGWFIDNIILSESLNIAPDVGPINGPVNIDTYGTYTYSVAASDSNGDNLIYAWEKGDDYPPQYDDGPGNGAGSININWQANGKYIIDCRVTDDGNPGLSTTSIAPLVVNVFVLPPNKGPCEDFEGPWPFAGWSFSDYTIAGTGQFWGKTNALSTNCLDADGATNSCYANNWFEEARWEDVTVPASGNAVLKITHTIWAEASSVSSGCWDGGMLFIDDNTIYSGSCISGFQNDRHIYSNSFWINNTYKPWPGAAKGYVWSGRVPDPDAWLNGFAVTYMDISNYADGNTHDFSFIFHADSATSCESGGNYHTWLIDKLEIFYE